MEQTVQEQNKIEQLMRPEEVWAKVKGYDHYEVSNLGRVRKISYLRTWVCSQVGYPQLQLFETDGCGKKRVGSKDKGAIKKAFLHRLLAEAFIPNPLNLPCVNHKDGNKQNNSLENLEWTTYSENLSHAYKHGLRKSRKKVSATLADYLAYTQPSPLNQEK